MAVAKPTPSPATVSEPFSSASCFPTADAVRGLAATADAVRGLAATADAVRGLAATADAVHARSGSEIAAAAMTVAKRDVRM
jgi:hypothetical protein